MTARESDAIRRGDAEPRRVDRRLSKTILAIAAAAALSGCASIGAQRSAADEPFLRALHDRYLKNASDAYDRGSIDAAKFHAARSVEVDTGSLPPPAALSPGELAALSAAEREDLAVLRAWLDGAVTPSSRRARPETAADARAGYDCWVRELAAPGDAAALADCRGRVEHALRTLSRGVAQAPDTSAIAAAVKRTIPGPVRRRPTETGAAEAPAPAAESVASTDAAAWRDQAPESSPAATPRPSFDRAARPVTGEFVVFFDRGSAALTPEAEIGLNTAVAAIRGRGVDQVRLIGFADATGDAETNKEIALRRAAAVRDRLKALAGDGLVVELVAAEQSEAPSRSADELMQALNRRVEISLPN